MANALLSQFKLHIVMKSRGFIQVYTAKQNLKPTVEAAIKIFNDEYNINISSLDELESFCLASKITIRIVQKPDPYPKDECNHLLLTVGGITDIIFDYEN